MIRTDHSPDKFKAAKENVSRFLWINAVASAEQYLAIAMCLVRFDYNVVLSLGLLLYISSHPTRSGEQFKDKEVCYICWGSGIVDLVWFFIMLNSWLISAPEGKAEADIFSKLYVWRLLVVLCGLASIGVKVASGEQGWIGWCLMRGPSQPAEEVERQRLLDGQSN